MIHSQFFNIRGLTLFIEQLEVTRMEGAIFLEIKLLLPRSTPENQNLIPWRLNNKLLAEEQVSLLFSI